MISIIMVVKNGMPFIADAIDSYESQNLLNKELIVVYSESNDRTFQYLNLNENRIDKLIIDYNGKNKFDSINLGIKHSSGKIIGILHTDDFFYSNNTLSIINNNFQKKSIDVLYGDCLFVDRYNTSKVTRYWKSEPFNFNKLSKGWMPPHTTLFIKKKIIESYDVNFKYSSDFDFINRIFSKNYNFFYLNRVISIMRTGGDSANFILKKIQEDYKIFKKNKLEVKFLIFKYLSKVSQFFITKPFLNKNLFLKKKRFLFIESIKDINKKLCEKNFIICAFNFTFFSYLINKIIKNDDILLWCDGFWANYLLSYTSKRNIPGRNLFSFENINRIKSKSKSIYFIGTIDKLLIRKLGVNKSKYKYINLKNNLTVHQIIDYLKNVTFIKNSVVIISITSPKQEFVAEYLFYKKNLTVICCGAAINMNLGKEKIAPMFMLKLKLEFLWRLQNNSFYRMKRLLTSLIDFYKYKI